MSNPVAAFFGVVLGVHGHAVPHHHHYSPVRIVIERVAPAAHATTMIGTKRGPPLIVSVTDRMEDIGLPSGTRFEIDNLGDHPVHLIVENQAMTIDSHSAVFLSSRFSAVSAVMDQGELSILNVWTIR